MVLNIYIIQPWVLPTTTNNYLSNPPKLSLNPLNPNEKE